MARHERWELAQMQSLSLDSKIRMTEQRIKVWIEAFGEDGVYVSFSGGKDSTVLLDIVRNKMGLKQIPAVFVDTGLEYPEIREFIRSFENVVWLKPKMNFKQVIEKYGYPFFSKETSEAIYYARKAQRNEISPKKYKYGTSIRLLQLQGKMPHKKNGEPTGEYSKMFDKSRYQFMLDAPFEVSNRCCSVMKKTPLKQIKGYPITAQMAQESKQRTSQWLKNGCNGFEMKSPISNPMAFWTEQDVLLYIKKYEIPICSVYGEIVDDVKGTEEVSGQMTISDIKGFEDSTLFDAERRPLKTTGCDRTGCMFCGYGCHLEKGEGRFEQMKKTHPKQYEWIMKPWEQGGLGYKEVIDWINEHGNLNIRY